MYSGTSEFDGVGLSQRILQGDSTAEELLISRFQPRIRAFLSVRTGDRNVVEELGQEVMIAMVCALREGRLREPERLSAFVYGIARNLLSDYMRKRAREKLEPLSPDLDFAAKAPVLEESEHFQTARREIESLEEVDRRILTMTLIDGLKPGEIAAALRLSGEVVRQRKSRALKKLVDRLNPPSQLAAHSPLS